MCIGIRANERIIARGFNVEVTGIAVKASVEPTAHSAVICKKAGAVITACSRVVVASVGLGASREGTFFGRLKYKRVEVAGESVSAPLNFQMIADAVLIYIKLTGSIAEIELLSVKAGVVLFGCKGVEIAGLGLRTT